jgi:integrase
MPRHKLTPAFILNAEMPKKGDRIIYWDASMPGFGLMVMDSGVRSFVFQYRNVLQQSRRMSWSARIDGSSTGLTFDQARSEARKVAGDVERGIDPVEQRRQERKKAAEERRKVAMASATTLKAIVAGMGRVKPKERERTRVLTDDEIRDLWAGLDEETKAGDIHACYAFLMRRCCSPPSVVAKLAEAVWQEVEHLERGGFKGDVLTIPGARMKGKRDHAVPLTPAVLVLIGDTQRDVKTYPFMFSMSGGERPFVTFSKATAALDGHIAKLRKEAGGDPLPSWVLHDLRRTAKTLMTRAGVRPDVSERVLSHVIPGVEGVYDRWGYLPEKHDALSKLAALIERIINPPADNVALLNEHRARR